MGPITKARGRGRGRTEQGLRGRLLGLVFVAALPPVVMAELGAVAVLPDALGFT